MRLKSLSAPLGGHERNQTVGKRKWAWRLLTLILALVLVPYLFSRLLAPQSRLILCQSGDSEAIAASDTLRIACYNIAHGRGLAESNWDGGDAETRLKRLDQIAALLNEINADVVVLNEVDFDASWSNHVNQAEYLATKCQYPYRVEERNLDFRVLHRTWRFGNAILSRLPLTEPELIDLPSYSELETLLAGKKRAFGVDVSFGEQKVHLVAAHLSHRSEDLRERSAQKIIQHVQSQSIPNIVAGDMNSSPPEFPRNNQTKDGRNAIETLLKSGLFTSSQPDPPQQDSQLTFRSDKPQLVIDWFFATKELSFGDSYQVIDSQLSDHRPIVIQYQPAAQGN